MINEALVVKEIIKKGIINDIEVEQFGDVIVHYDKLLNYKYSFNTKTGLSIRTGIFVDGKETTEDVFSARFPHLIDVRINITCKSSGSTYVQTLHIKVKSRINHSNNKTTVNANFKWKVFIFYK